LEQLADISVPAVVFLRLTRLFTCSLITHGLSGVPWGKGREPEAEAYQITFDASKEADKCDIGHDNNVAGRLQ